MAGTPIIDYRELTQAAINTKFSEENWVNRLTGWTTTESSHRESKPFRAAAVAAASIAIGRGV